MISNAEKEAVWQAYRARRPVRVPVTFGVNVRVVLFDPKWNPRGITFQQYMTDPAATADIQIAFMEYLRTYLHQYCDHPTGPQERLDFWVDNQNTYDSAYFGAPLVFRDGQVADVEPYLAGAGKGRIFEIDIDHPLDNPFVKRCLGRHEGLKREASRRGTYKGIPLGAGPPGFGFDGHLTIAVNLRGHEMLSDLYEDPEYARKLMDFIHRGVVIRNRAMAELFGRKAFVGPGGSFADDSIALVGPAMYREMILPFHRAWYALWGPGPHSIHLCGDATRHFATLHRELNVCSFDTGFPVDHGALRRELGDDVEIQGGPEVHLLLEAAPEQVYERTRSILASGVMRGGRFILREANNLPPRTPEANLAAMYRCCLEHGRYGNGREPVKS